MKSAFLASLAALALCGAAAPASATAVTYTFSGSLISGHDDNNLFGLGNGSLAGDAYKGCRDLQRSAASRCQLDLVHLGRRHRRRRNGRQRHA